MHLSDADSLSKKNGLSPIESVTQLPQLTSARVAMPPNPALAPAGLPPPLVVEPVGKSAERVIIFLHGFTCTGRSCAGIWVPKLRAMGVADATRLVFLNAPKRARGVCVCPLLVCFAPRDKVRNK